MKRVPRGLVAALAVSLAAHAGVIVARWTGAAPGTKAAPATPVIVARIVEARAPEQAADINATAPTPEVPAEPAQPITEPSPPAPAPEVLVAPAPPAPMPRPEEAKPAASPTAIPKEAEVASSASQLRRAAADEAVSPAVAAGSSSGNDGCPQPVDDIDLESAAALGNRGGVATLRVDVSDRGVVDKVEVVRSTPPGLLDAAALSAAFVRVRFSPCLRAGVPVSSEVLYEVTVAPVGRGTDASGRTY